jgi:hypothetical protein
MKKLLISFIFAGIFAYGQTPAPTVLPTAVSAVAEYNQLSSPQFAAGICAMYTSTVQSSIGMYNSSCADAFPVHATDPTTGKTFYAISASFRQGIHEKLLATGPWVFLLGADVGPGFSSTSTSGISLSATGSFVFTTVYKVNSFMNIVVPIRALYISNIGWNPVLQFGVSFNLSKLPAPVVK